MLVNIFNEIIQNIILDNNRNIIPDIFLDIITNIITDISHDIDPDIDPDIIKDIGDKRNYGNFCFCTFLNIIYGFFSV